MIKKKKIANNVRENTPHTKHEIEKHNEKKHTLHFYRNCCTSSFLQPQYHNVANGVLPILLTIDIAKKNAVC